MSVTQDQNRPVCAICNETMEMTDDGPTYVCPVCGWEVRFDDV
jgi:predicted RNA-binding Zn-ribbon protein involved in translation (DUF1610 family)